MENGAAAIDAQHGRQVVAGHARDGVEHVESAKNTILEFGNVSTIHEILRGARGGLGALEIRNL